MGKSSSKLMIPRQNSFFLKEPQFPLTLALTGYGSCEDKPLLQSLPVNHRTIAKARLTYEWLSCIYKRVVEVASKLGRVLKEAL
jgi:hypothetical protein